MSTACGRRAISAIDTSGGGLRIDDLAGELGATAALKASPAPDWARLALDCGYFDRSHLIHDFQEFAGSAPERFLNTS